MNASEVGRGLRLNSVRFFDAGEQKICCGDIAIEDGVITGVGHLAPTPNLPTFPGEDMLCLPGLVNAHLHPSKEIYHGLYQPAATELLLVEVHKNNVQETDEGQSLATARSLASSLLRGVTTVGIFTSRPEADASQAKVLGNRAAVFYSQNDVWQSVGASPQTSALGAIFDNFERVFGEFDSGRITVHPATASEFSCTDGLLKMYAQLAKRLNRRFCMHLQEGPNHNQRFRQLRGMSAVEHLSLLRMLESNITLVHTSVLSDDDIVTLIDYQAGLIHCPISNSFTSSGKMPLSRFAGKQPVGLGTDSAMINPANDLPFEAMFTLLYHGDRDSRDKVSPEAVLDLVTVGGAKTLGLNNCGRIEPGMLADIAMFDPETEFDWINHAEGVLQTFSRQRPRHVLVSGNAVVRDYQLTENNVSELNGRFVDHKRNMAAEMKVGQVIGEITN